MVSTTESSGNLVQHRLLVPRLSLMSFYSFLSGGAGLSRSVW